MPKKRPLFEQSCLEGQQRILFRYLALLLSKVLFALDWIFDFYF